MLTRIFAAIALVIIAITAVSVGDTKTETIFQQIYLVEQLIASAVISYVIVRLIQTIKE
ncbi:hypothetical protein [Herbiconiux daphne]|uniref:Uncharacterized protein n=1 Tax=Herbiconiux daphne TaxID=2970914 RepID=A0ABT2H919_9MICO|nr:hypothetical protein [Herbiconiux daphne]MCS5736438.1 hypothetical protein [Herbiconiux daphne]